MRPFFVYTGDWFETYDTERDAREAAQAELVASRDDPSVKVEKICWGRIVERAGAYGALIPAEGILPG